MTHLHYVPLSLGAAGVFLALVAGLAVLAAIGLLAHVSKALGLHPLTVTFILFASLVGSAVNIPLTLTVRSTARRNTPVTWFP